MSTSTGWRSCARHTFGLDHLFMSLFSTIGWVARLVIVEVLLITQVSPVLGLLIVFAVPVVVVATWRPGVERAVRERVAPHERRMRHLFVLGTTAPPGKELRVTGNGAALAERRRRRVAAGVRPAGPLEVGDDRVERAAWAVFGLGYVAAVVYTVTVVDASPGQVVLVLVVGSQLSQFVGAAVGELAFLRSIWLDISRRLMWLEDYAASVDARSDGVPPDRLDPRHPVRARVVPVPRQRPAGPRRRQPGPPGRSGGRHRGRQRRRQDHAGQAAGPDVRPGPGPDRRRRHRPLVDVRAGLAGAVGRCVPGLLPVRADGAWTASASATSAASASAPAVTAAVGRGGATDVVEHLPQGLDTQLGPSWDSGVEVSFGQWQKLALARGFMREEPLLLVLDEPTAALDAETEHALFERFADAARQQAGNGRVTVLVSHRFSTVRMADVIVVLDGARVLEVGSHADLMAQGGRYAELYGIQSDAFR